MNADRHESTPWLWPRLRLRWVLLALTLFLANGIWRAMTVSLDLRASGFHTPIGEPMVWELTSAVVVWALLPMVQTVVLNAPWRRVGWGRFLTWHAAGCVLFWGVHVAGMWALRIWIYGAVGWGPYNYGQAIYRVPMEGFKDVISFSVLALLFHLLEVRRARMARELAASQLETELREARLQALSAQLDPHFLFNALNTLSALLYEDVPKADRLITALGEMLRDGLRAGGPTWSLARELDHLQHYLAFAEARFGDRLQVQQTIEPGLESVQVPRFALQRLVENALKHNEGTAGRVLHVRIEARNAGDMTALTVVDDGDGFQTDNVEGVGLENLRRCLILLHGDQCRLEAANTPEGGAKVSIHLPRGVSHA